MKKTHKKKTRSAHVHRKPRKTNVEVFKNAEKWKQKLSSRLQKKPSKAKRKPREQSDKEYSAESKYKSNKISCWELTDIAHEKRFEKHWQDNFYELTIPLPPRLKLATKRYLYYHDVYNSQLFEIYDTGSRLYLMRWAGPSPKSSGDEAGQVPFMVLWNEFVLGFETKKYKRVYLHPDEEEMREFLQKLHYAEKIEGGNDYKYEKWYIHKPEEYSSGEIGTCNKL